MVVNKRIELCNHWRFSRRFTGELAGKLLRVVRIDDGFIDVLCDPESPDECIDVEIVGPDEALVHLNMDEYVGNRMGHAVFLRSAPVDDA